MRRVAMMFGMAMVLALVVAGAALAAERFNVKNCGPNALPCTGSQKDDLIHERQGTVKDRIYGLDGHDVLDANNFNFDRDVLYGGARGDKLLTNDGDGRDVARGGGGRDVCYVDPGDRTVGCNVVRDKARAKFDATADTSYLD